MEYLFEASWEVCNRVGGIYTVLSTHARQLEKRYGDGLCFVGPDLDAVYPSGTPNPLFSPEPTSLDAWKSKALSEGLAVRTGRWEIPGRPLAILVDFRSLYQRQNEIYADFWNWFHIDSLHGYGDYAEACMFAYACGQVVESRYRYLSQEAAWPANDQAGTDATPSVIAHFHEWTTGLGLLYCRHFVPRVATVFTTHATSIGRSICGNGKQLYAYMDGYDGDQMARELNMESKHSVEKTAAHQADCFTTVSPITARECTQLLGKTPDVITLNGFEDSFVLPAAKARALRREVRRQLLDVAQATLGYALPDDALLLSTGGRYEFRNKGLDTFIASLDCLRRRPDLERTVVAYILVPGDVSAPRQEVLQNLQRLKTDGTQALQPVYHPYNTHWMNHIEDDRILNALKARGLANAPEDKVKVIFVPCYLHGDDGIFARQYYDLLQGFDLTAFLSYYEPWGYTPLESVAFSIPTMTTTLSGFGAWYLENGHAPDDIAGGVCVLDRCDGNEAEVAHRAARQIASFAQMDQVQADQVRENARKVSRQALWTKFIKQYEKAYRLALKHATMRNRP